MPAHVPALTTEADLLAAYVNQQLDGVRATVFGLTEERARSTPTASAASIAGLLSHAVEGTNSCLDRIEAAPDRLPETDFAATMAKLAAEWTPTRSLDELVDALNATRDRVTRVCSQVALDAPVPVPTDAPWWPKDVESWQVRYLLLHLIEEVARHAGHADIIRETIDGATMYELKAAAEDWPPMDYLKPWSPLPTPDHAAPPR